MFCSPQFILMHPTDTSWALIASSSAARIKQAEGGDVSSSSENIPGADGASFTSFDLYSSQRLVLKGPS